MNNLKSFKQFLSLVVGKCKTCKTLFLQILIDMSHELTIQKVVQRVADCSIVNFYFSYFFFLCAIWFRIVFICNGALPKFWTNCLYGYHNSSNTCSFGTFDKNLIYIPKETWNSQCGAKKFMKLHWSFNPTSS